MSLRIRRGTESQRANITFDLGELAYTTNTGKLYVGDGVTQGGRNILASSAGSGLLWNATTQQLETTGGGGGGLGRVEDDTSPSLGGGLDLSGNDITGIGNINIVGSIGTSVGLSTNLALNSYAVNGTGDIDITGTITSSGSISNSTLTFTDSHIASTDVTVNGTRLVIIGDGIGVDAHTLMFTPTASQPPVIVKSIAQPAAGGGIGIIPKITLTGYGVNINNPQRVVAGSYYSAISAGAWEPTTNTTNPSVGIFFRSDPFGAVNATNVTGKLEIITSGGTTTAVQRFLTFDSLGQLAVNQARAYATLDVNGPMRLIKQTAAPGTPYEGMIAVADRTTWDPLTKGTGPSYAVYYNGSAWIELTNSISGTSVSTSLFLAGQQTGPADFDHGYTFSGTEGGHDTGVFSAADGIMKLVSNSNTVVTVNSNQTITLATLTSAPSAPTTGTIAVADGTLWDPCTVGGLAYPVFYNGSTWIKMFS